jgi:hypothetical protein
VVPRWVLVQRKSKVREDSQPHGRRSRCAVSAVLSVTAGGQSVVDDPRLTYRDKWLRLIHRVIKHYQANELHQTILEKEDYDSMSSYSRLNLATLPVGVGEATDF